jgi:ElaB/YqjD/DUF883 family membrane-anchored ribosome-binding protein
MAEIWRRRRSTPLGMEDLKRNLRVLENELTTGGRRSGAALNRTLEDATENIATRLSALADQIRGGAASASGQVARYGGEAARRGEDGIKWLSDETASHPLPTLAIAVGIGVFIGMMLRSGNAKETNE